MLALPRIAAVRNGEGTLNHPERAGKLKNASNNPFVQLFAELGTHALKKDVRNENPSSIQKPPAAAKPVPPENLPVKTVKVHGPQEAGLANLGLGNNGRVADGKKIEPSKSAAREETPAKSSKALDRKAAHESVDGLAVLAGGLQGANNGAAGSEGKNQKLSGDKKNGDASTLDAASSGTAAASVTRKEGPAISVIDLRLGNERKNASKGKADSESSNIDAKARLATSNQINDAAGSNALDLRPADVRRAEVSGMDRPDPSAKAPPSLSESLAARLREGASDIVRSAQVVLRDGDAGLIRLRLEPESLGNVKIELKMTEKQISGKIIVESDIAGDAFRSSMDSLRDAFAESGFETTTLELEVRNGMTFGKGAEDGSDDGRSEDGNPYFSRSLRSLTAAVPALGSGGRDGLLDMIV